MHKRVPIIMGCGGVLDNFSFKKPQMHLSCEINVVRNNEDVKPLSSVYPFIGTKSILLVQKDLNNFLKILLNSLWKQNFPLLYKLLK